MRVPPTKLPKVSPTRFDVGFLQSGVVAYLIPLMGSVQIARVNAHASRLVGNLALLKKVFHAPVVVAGRSSRNFPRTYDIAIALCAIALCSGVSATWFA